MVVGRFYYYRWYNILPIESLLHLGTVRNTHLSPPFFQLTCHLDYFFFAGVGG